MLSRLGRLTKINPRLVFFIVLSSGLFYLLFIWRLDYLGLSNSETTAAGNSSSIKAIIDNPLYGPHKLIQYGLQNLFEFSAFSLRLTSVILAVLFIVCFYLISAKWLGKIIALAATIIFASLPWTIIFGRSGTPFILFLSPVLVLASYYWLISIVFICSCQGTNGIYYWAVTDSYHTSVCFNDFRCLCHAIIVSQKIILAALYGNRRRHLFWFKQPVYISDLCTYATSRYCLSWPTFFVFGVAKCISEKSHPKKLCLRFNLGTISHSFNLWL